MVTIKINKSNKCNGDYSLFISFPYDQFIVNVMRGLSIRYWHPDSKEWETPLKNLDDIKRSLNNYKLNIIDSNNILSKSDDIQYIPSDYQFKTKPFKHQIEGLEYGLRYDRFLLGDEQGLGKTKQIIDLACIKKQQKQYKHCLIICGVNGLKWNWRAEIEKHSNERGYILGTRYKKDGKEYIGTMADRLDDLQGIENFYKNSDKINLKELFNAYPYFIITNIETLRNEKIIEKLKLLCDNNIINMIALDEGHKCKDPTSQQGKALLKLQSETMISMTGTPLMNNPLDLFIHLLYNINV